MRVYCINLDRRPDRLEYIQGELSRFAIPFDRVAAIDAKDPAVAVAAEKIPPMARGPRMSAGAYGCFQSHREVWRRLIASGDHAGIVIEDDLILAPGFASLLESDWFPNSADIIKLETFGIRIHVAKSGEVAAPDGRKLSVLRSFHPGTGCYAISARAAKRLLAETEVFNEPIDRFMFDPISPAFKSYRILQVFPAPTVQGDRAAKAGVTASGAEGWAETSIVERFQDSANSLTTRREGKASRLQRRLSEELRGLLAGSRYVTVPFG